MFSNILGVCVPPPPLQPWVVSLHACTNQYGEYSRGTICTSLVSSLYAALLLFGTVFCRPQLPWCRYGLLAPSQLKKSGGLSWVFPPYVMAWKFSQSAAAVVRFTCFSQRITILCLIFRFLKTTVLSIFSGFCCCCWFRWESKSDSWLFHLGYQKTLQKLLLQLESVLFFV